MNTHALRKEGQGAKRAPAICWPINRAESQSWNSINRVGLQLSVQ